MLYLITGVPGTGKTLRAVEMIEKWLKEGRDVYTNIGELTLVVDGPDGTPRQALTLDQCPQDAEHKDNQGTPFVGPDEPPSSGFDWRRAPAGSVIVIDEAQQWFPAIGRGGRSVNPQITTMEVHRHAGFDLMLITQHPGLIDSNARRLVTQHQHGRRPFGRHMAHWSIRDRVMDVGSRTELDSGETETWRYPTRLFGTYKSAVEHTHKGRIPTKLKIIGVAMVVMIAFIGYRLPGLMKTFGSVSQTEVAQVEKTPGVFPAVHVASVSTTLQEQIVASSQPASWQDVDWVDGLRPAVSIAGCIATANRCRCYSIEGDPMAMDASECMRRVAEPMPFSVRPLRSGSGEDTDGAAIRASAEPAA